LNENLEKLSCSHNLLTSLQLNDKLKMLYCHNNQFTSLHLNEKLEKLICSNNQLTSLHLNDNLQELSCEYNRLNSLPVLNKNVRIFYRNNPIYEIINNYDVDKINQKMRVLNQFRYLYYCLKFKKRFRDLLWIKIREPKIRKRYSHAYLVEHLHEDTDLDELLSNW
jgi:hypothetical protein